MLTLQFISKDDVDKLIYTKGSQMLVHYHLDTVDKKFATLKAHMSILKKDKNLFFVFTYPSTTSSTKLKEEIDEKLTINFSNLTALHKECSIFRSIINKYALQPSDISMSHCTTSFKAYHNGNKYEFFHIMGDFFNIRLNDSTKVFKLLDTLKISYNVV